MRTFFDNQAKIDQLKIYTVAAMRHKSARETAYLVQPLMAKPLPLTWKREDTLPAEFLFAAKMSKDVPQLVDLWLSQPRYIDKFIRDYESFGEFANTKAMLKMYNKSTLDLQNEIVCVGLYLGTICEVEDTLVDVGIREFHSWNK